MTPCPSAGGCQEDLRATCSYDHLFGSAGTCRRGPRRSCWDVAERRDICAALLDVAICSVTLLKASSALRISRTISRLGIGFGATEPERNARFITFFFLFFFDFSNWSTGVRFNSGLQGWCSFCRSPGCRFNSGLHSPHQDY